MSKVRLLKASPFYDACIHRMYASIPSLAESSYSDQYQALMGSCFGWSEFWKKNLESLGTYVVEEVIVNAELLQKRWAQEHSVEYSSDSWVLDILSAQIAEFKPDVFFAHDYWFIDPSFRLRMRAQFPRMKIIGWDGIAMNDKERFSGTDLVLSCADHVVQYYRRQRISSYLLPFGFEQSILDRLDPSAERHSVSFVGGITLMKRGHYQRVELLKKVMETFDIELRVSGSVAGITAKDVGKYLQEYDFAGLLHYLSKRHDAKNILDHSKSEAFGLEMYQVLADSAITVNSHIDAALNNAGNMRLFEATGVGTCLVTDWKENLADYFVPDVEVVCYRNPDEAVEKIRYLLGHEEERRAIAKAGQAKTLQVHAFLRRAQQLDEILRQDVLK